jgi:peptidoglycan/xylan/chitin deacetylase (PgdA/CDA1 family)
MSIRVDRIATLYVFHPLAEHLASDHARIPILMYHSISAASELRHPYFHTTTSPSRFAEQMQFLSDNGYSTIRLSQAMNLATQCQPKGSRPVVITFDDGFRDFYTEAFPVLERHRFTANMFLPTAYVGERRSSFNSTECLTWSEVRELDAAGIEFGSHTVTHPQLRDLGAEEVDYELRYSKETIEDKIGKQVACFSYPYAFPETVKPFVGKLRDTLARCGYRLGVSTVIGSAKPADDLLFLRRLPVNSSDDMPLFRAKLEGGYDWLHGVQRLKKALHIVTS